MEPKNYKLVPVDNVFDLSRMSPYLTTEYDVLHWTSFTRELCVFLNHDEFCYVWGFKNGRNTIYRKGMFC